MLLLLGLFEERVLLESLLLVPGGEVVDELGVGLKEVVAEEVCVVAILNAFEGVELRVEVVADLDVGLGVGKVQLLVIVFLLEKQF